MRVLEEQTAEAFSFAQEPHVSWAIATKPLFEKNHIALGLF